MSALGQLKCRSEQQLMIDLSKFVQAKEYTSKKMGELLRELSLYYICPDPSKSLAPSVLKDLYTLLQLLKNRKEDLKVVRLVYCFIARFIDFARRRECRSGNSCQYSDTAKECLPSTLATLHQLLDYLDANELSQAASTREHVALRLYAFLCCTFDKTDAILSRIRPIIYQSPVWGILTATSGQAETKRRLLAPSFLLLSFNGKKDMSSQIGALQTAFQTIRYHLKPQLQIAFLEKLVEAAFLLHNGAGRHAAAMLDSLLQNEEIITSQIMADLERHITKFRPSSLYNGDIMASLYLVRLFGRISRLPISSGAPADPGIACDLLDLSFAPMADTKAGHSNMDTKLQAKTFTVSKAFSEIVSSHLIDILVTFYSSAGTEANIPKAIVAAAIEELVVDAPASICFLKIRGALSLFELIAATILKILRDPATHTSAIGLHRIYRVLQKAAESLDGSIQDLKCATIEIQKSLNYFCKLTDKMIDSVDFSNEFVALQCFHALIWLLPRYQEGDVSNEQQWDALVHRLLQIKETQISPELCEKLTRAFYDRAVTSRLLHHASVDTKLLLQCLRVTLHYFQNTPCPWHGNMLVDIWRIQVSSAAMQDAAFTSINSVLDAHYPGDNSIASVKHRRAAVQLVQYHTLCFLNQIDIPCAIKPPESKTALIHRLIRYHSIAPSPLRQLTTQVLLRLQKQSAQSSDQDLYCFTTHILAAARHPIRSK